MARLLEYFMPVFSLGLAIDRQVATDLPHGHADEQARRLIEQARSEARAAGKASPAVESAAFAVVAWFDEIVARNPSWRGADGPLQALLFNTYGAGDEFFEHLANLKVADGEAREVYYFALLLGFAGPYYFEAGDHGELARIKELNSRQLPVAPLSLPALREERITPQPYLLAAPPGPRYPKLWSGWFRRSVAPPFDLPAPEHPEQAREASTRMRTAIRQAKQTLTQEPEFAGPQPLYRIPWLLFLGDADANVHGLMQAASNAAAFRAMPGDERATWRWWLSASMVAIETDPGMVCASSARPERGLWHQALGLLADERRRLPLNGIVVCIGVSSLLRDADGLQETARRLRRLIDESMQSLRLQLPVYVLVTGLEQLPGYAVLRTLVPAEVFSQALGWRLPEHTAQGSDTGAMFDSFFASMAERLHALRLALLERENRLLNRRGVVEFVQSMIGLQARLRQLIELLQERDGSARVPHWRGLYLVAAAGPDAQAGSFVADLFAQLLPADQPLASRG